MVAYVQKFPKAYIWIARTPGGSLKAFGLHPEGTTSSWDWRVDSVGRGLVSYVGGPEPSALHKPGIVEHTCNPSRWEVEAGE